MNKLKNLFCVIFIITFILISIGITGASSNLKDIDGTKYESSVNALIELGIVNGYPDGTFMPENTVTRAEGAKVLALTLGWSDLEYTGKTKFSDVDKHWAYNYINLMAANGYISEYSGDEFKPDEELTYEDFITSCVKCLGYENEKNYIVKAKDLDLLKNVEYNSTNEPVQRGECCIILWNMLRTPMWEIQKSNGIENEKTTIIYDDVEGTKYETYAGKMTELGILSGFADNTFRPNQTIDRAELATIIVYLMEWENETYSKSNFSDVPKDHWAYEYISIVVDKDIILGYPDSTFEPDGNVSYAEAVTILIRVLGLEENVDTIGTWPSNYIAKAKMIGLLIDVEYDKTTDPTERGELSVLLWNTLKILGEQNRITEVNKPSISENVFEYTGEVIKLPVKNFDSNTMKIKGNKATFPGEYEAVVYLARKNLVWDDGSSGEITFNWKIESNGIIEIPVPEVEENIFEFNGEYQNIELNFFEEDVMNISGDCYKDAGKYIATVSLKDKDNYVWEDDKTSGDRTFEWEIEKAILAIPKQRKAREYNGKKQEAYLKYYDEDEHENLINITGNTGKDVGVYTATVSLIDPINSYWEDDTVTDKEIKWEIVGCVISESDMNFSKVYNGKEQEIDEIEDYEDIIRIVSSEKGVDVGDYKVTLELLDIVNYQWEDGTTSTKEFTWIITEDIVKIPRGNYILEAESGEDINGDGIIIDKRTYAEKLEYTGENQEMIPSRYFNEDLIDITNNIEKEIGTYEAILTLKDSKNYMWSDSTKEPKKVLWQITKRQINIYGSGIYKPSQGMLNKTYNGEEQQLELEGFDENLMTISGDKATNAGMYKAIISAIEPDKVELINGKEKGSTVTVEWEIEKDLLSTPKCYEKEYTYTGEDIELELSRFESEYMNITGNIGKEIGKYTAIISLKDQTNYAWKDESTDDIIFNWEITNCVRIPTMRALTTYEGYEVYARLRDFDEDIMNISGDVGIEVGKYIAVVSLKDNTLCWEDGTSGEKYIEWEIEPAYLIVPKEICERKYNGAEQEAFLMNFDEEIMNITNNKATEIGTYTAVVSLKDSKNYRWGIYDEDGDLLASNTSDKNVVWHIASEITSNIIIRIPSHSNIYYDGNEHEIDISDDTKIYKDGKFVATEDMSEYYTVNSQKGTEVGTYKATISLKDKNQFTWFLEKYIDYDYEENPDDFSTEDQTIRWKILKNYAYVYTPSQRILKTYNGEEQEITKDDLRFRLPEEYFEITGNKATEPGVYEMKAVLKDAEHCELISIYDRAAGKTIESGEFSLIWEIVGNTSGEDENLPGSGDLPSGDVSGDNSSGSGTTGNGSGGISSGGNSSGGSSSGGSGSGGGISNSSKVYKVKTSTSKGGKIETNKEIQKGEDLVLNIIPDEGYKIVDVKINGKSVGAVTEYTMENIESAPNIVVTFEKLTEEELIALEEEKKNEIFKKQFVDVTEENWYYESVKYAYTNGLFKGVEENQFAPDMTMNRAMLVTVLHRLDGEEKVEANEIFNDIPKDSYYQEAVNWASNNKIVQGIGDREFAPLNEITREQLVVMLYRYAKLKGQDMETDTDLTNYDDANTISDYAKEAFGWAIEQGYINGRSENELAPKATATRAEVATILMRFKI